MFDEDEASTHRGLISRPFVADGRNEDAFAEAESLDLPFDLSYVVDYNPYVYGRPQPGPNVGRWIAFHGAMGSNLGDEVIACEPGIGMIIAEEHGRFLLGFENDRTGWVYLGWVLRGCFDFIDIHYEYSRWTH